MILKKPEEFGISSERMLKLVQEMEAQITAIAEKGGDAL